MARRSSSSAGAARGADSRGREGSLRRTWKISRGASERASGRFRLAITAAVTGQFILAPEAYFKDANVLPCLKCTGHKSPFASYLRVEFPVERVEEAGDMFQLLKNTLHISPRAVLVHIFDSLSETAY